MRHRFLLVILLALSAAAIFALARAGLHPSVEAARPVAVESAGAYGPPVHLADLADASITESSGLVASRRNPGLFWTHNDSGGGPFIYALDRRGQTRGVWQVAGAANRDWEDIAAGPGPRSTLSYLYLGDIGDNSRRREEVIVYRVVEPLVPTAGSASTRKNPRQTETAEVFRLSYPDGSHDAEALLVHPRTGDIYIVTKSFLSAAGVYRAPVTALRGGRVTKLVRVGDLRVPGLLSSAITGGDISPDGRRVVLCDYFYAYEMVLPGSAVSFDKIWDQPLSTINLGSRQQGESICYRLDGRAILATSEKRPTPLIEVERSGR